MGLHDFPNDKRRTEPCDGKLKAPTGIRRSELDPSILLNGDRRVNWALKIFDRAEGLAAALAGLAAFSRFGILTVDLILNRRDVGLGD